jgi:hypothetical protein
VQFLLDGREVALSVESLFALGIEGVFPGADEVVV